FVWLVVLFMFAGTVCAGVAAIPFLEVASKTIPPDRRGTFFGVRRLSGGAFGILAGIVVAVVVGGEPTAAWTHGWLYRCVENIVEALDWAGHPFPYNYGILIVVGTALSAAGLFMFGLIREPDAVTTHKLQPLRDHFKDGFHLLRRRNYLLFFIVRVCWQLTSMAFPFYAAYAYSVLGFSEASVGVFVSIWIGSGVISNYLWGKLADSRGNRIVLVLTALIAVASPVAVLAVVWNGRSAAGHDAWMFWLLASTFVVNGFARSGRFISNMMYLLEFAPEERRPLYVGFMNSISFPFMLSPALGGWIVQAYSFQYLFAVSAFFAAVSVVLSALLVEPRVRRPAEEADYMT
ncbi:MAG: MFS transporter, partial [Candidatus Latescibacterota bacterium]